MTPSIATFLICVGILIMAWKVNRDTLKMLLALNDICEQSEHLPGIIAVKKFVDMAQRRTPDDRE